MNAKEAIKMAKAAFLDLFTDEPIQNLGLEEVSFEDETQQWHVTLGFHRMLTESSPFGISFPTDRIYKVVSIADANGRILSVKNRESAHV